MVLLSDGSASDGGLFPFMARFFVAGELVRATHCLVLSSSCSFVSCNSTITLLSADSHTLAAVITFLFNLKTFQAYK